MKHKQHLKSLKKQLKKQLKSQSITLTHSELEQIKQDAMIRGAEITNHIPLLILRDKLGWGEVRLKRYLDYYNDTIDSFNKGYVSLKDIQGMLKDEVNIEI